MPAPPVQQAFELALQHHQAGRLAEADALYRQILAVQPNFADAWHFLGVIAYQVGRFDLALQWIPQALVLDPNNPFAHSNLGEAYRLAGRLDEAIASYGRALQLNPQDANAYNNLGAALAAQGRMDGAIAAFQRVLQLQPGLPGISCNLGNALRLRGRLDEAVATFRSALRLKPDDADVHHNLGNTLKDQGRLDEAITSFRLAIGLRPDHPGMHDSLIFTLHFASGGNGRAIAEEHRIWNRRFADPARRFVQPYANVRNAERRLRIGYVSSGFRDNAIGRNVKPLLQFHDRRHFEVVCYAGLVHSDKSTEEFRQYANHWRSTLGMRDEALAEMIQRDGVDILVDLTQHTDGNRLPMFACRPAPVQVSFLGYPASAGVDAIENRISGRYLEEGGSAPEPTGHGAATDPLETREKILLIDSFWCYDPCGAEVVVNELPAKQNGRITLGCLNNFCKVNDPVLRLWARVLSRVKDAKLVLLTGIGSHRQRTVDFLEQEGVEAGRIEFVDRHPHREYLELYHRLDVVLDTFPYNGHTTSLDALWMGVPVVTLAGERAVSRAGLSQLTNLGLPELVAHTEDEYVAIAAQLADDFPRLAELRTTLRTRMEASVLMDGRHFARQIEDAYRAMWWGWCAEQRS